MARKAQTAARGKTDVATQQGGGTVVAKINHFKEQLELRRGPIQALLPPHLGWDKFRAIVITALGSNPRLMECTPSSLMKAVNDSAELGLSVNPAMREADIIPRWSAKAKVTLAVFQPRYGGLMKLARQSGQITKIWAHAVRDGDFFEYEYGLNKGLEHTPAENGKQGRLVAAYCCWKTADGESDFEVVTPRNIERSKMASQSPDKGPWKTDEEEMWRKTAVRRASKYMPSSASDAFQQAIALDTANDFGDGASIVEGEVVMSGGLDAEDITEDPDPPASKVMDKFEGRLGGEEEPPPHDAAPGDDGGAPTARSTAPACSIALKENPAAKKRPDAEGAPTRPPERPHRLAVPKGGDGTPDWQAWLEAAAEAVETIEPAAAAAWRTDNADLLSSAGFGFPNETMVIMDRLEASVATAA